MKTHLLDIILCIPLLWGIIRGFMRGVVFELAILAAITLGFLGGFTLAGIVTGYLAGTYSITGKWLPSLSFILVFIVISLLVLMLGKLLTKVISLTGLGILNRIAGGLFGLIKWFLILGIILCLSNPLIERFHLISPAKKEQSWLYKPLCVIGKFLIPGMGKIWNPGT